MTAIQRPEQKALLNFVTALGAVIFAVVVSYVVLGQQYLTKPGDGVPNLVASCPGCATSQTVDPQTALDANHRAAEEQSPAPERASSSAHDTGSQPSSARIARGDTTMVGSSDLGANDLGQGVVDQAMQLAHAGRADEAEARLKEILRADPKNQDALVAMGILAKQSLGRPAEARPYFEKALELNPDNHFVLNELLGLYGEQNQVQEGLRYFEDLSARSPQASLVLQGRARLLGQLGRDGDAIPLLKAVAMGPESTPEVWHELSHAYLKTGDYDSSLSIMDQMITNESSVHREPSQAEDAASDGQKRLTILKLNKADILITRGNKQRGDLQAARQILDDVAEASGDDAQVSALRRRLAETI